MPVLPLTRFIFASLETMHRTGWIRANEITILLFTTFRIDQKYIQIVGSIELDRKQVRQFLRTHVHN